MERDYIFEILHSEADLRTIAAEWRRLWAEDSHATPFQSPHWNLAWWHHLNPGGTLAIVAVRHQSVLIALAPWYLSSYGEAGQRVLRFLGTGVSDYLDVLQPQRHKISWFRDLAQWSLQQLNCDECDLDELSCDSALMANTASEPVYYVEHRSVCPVLHLSDSSDSLDGSISRAAARALGYYRRRLAREHQFEIEAADQQNIEYLLSELFRLHHELWATRGQSGVLCGKQIAEFHHEAALGLLNEDALRLYVLRIDGRSAAVFYGFACHRRTYYYLGGFAPEFARFNPGTILIGHAIEQAIQEQSLEFNFLRGGEPYKYWWGASDRFSYRLRLPKVVLSEE